MSKLFDAADRYLEESDWKTIAVLKICLIALGIMLGIRVKKEHKKPVFIVTLIIFFATVIPLVKKFIKVWKEA